MIYSNQNTNCKYKTNYNETSVKTRKYAYVKSRYMDHYNKKKIVNTTPPRNIEHVITKRQSFLVSSLHIKEMMKNKPAYFAKSTKTLKLKLSDLIEKSINANYTEQWIINSKS